MQARDLDAELAHEGHVVLDHDHGLVAVDLLEQLRGLPRLGVGHAGDRLVDQQQLRVLRQQHADLEPLLLAVRQAAGRGDRAAASRRMVSRMLVDAAVLVGASSRHSSVARGAAVVLQRQQQIVLDGVALEHGRLLELAADAELGDLRPRRAWSGRALPSKEHVAVVGPGLAGDDVHHRGLAGAVRADDGAHLAGLDRERQIVERRKPSNETVTPSR